MTDIKQEVRQFYDQVGWQLVSEEFYQNARYEDLRPVSSEYIHRCHLRVARHLRPQGRYLLDAGSGPVQYPEYLEYSRGYRYRVCADISITALKEARKRVGDHGLYVAADVANLPFKPGTFEGLVSLHTIHHLPEEEHLRAYRELFRVLAFDSAAVVVNGWPTSQLMRLFEPLIRLAQRLRHVLSRLGSKANGAEQPGQEAETPGSQETKDKGKPKGTFTSRHDVAWVKNEVGALMEVDIRVWRSVSVRFLRALIHPRLGGRALLRLLFWLEERLPHFFGERGKYPLIVIRKV
ncbi:MAG: class I SAM-dependent methyltransferase [Anaerolineales bacterium]|nr:class I SAM-dependent methyltransferase [Anaerolineales bacterium]